MKKIIIVLTSLLCSTGFAQDLSKSPKVANVVNGLTVCDRSLLKDTITLPLSYFTEEMKIVKMEMSDEAVVAPTPVIIGEQHFLVKGSGNNPYKLFSKDGKFITNIGGRGRGPGEYQNVYDEVLDEKNDRIYLLPWSSQVILVYDLKGKALDPVRLPMNVPKGKFFVDPSGTMVTVFALPFEGSPYITWTQKMSGEPVNGIAPGNLAINPRNASGAFTGFNNEVMSGKHTSKIDAFLFTFGERRDTLYHYDSNVNKLLPQFTVNYGNRNLPIFTYHELPRHYMGSFSETIQTGPNTFGTTKHSFFVVEKGALKGSFFKLKNDYFDDQIIDFPVYTFSNGYFVRNYDPGDLLEHLEKALSNRNLSAAMRQKLTQLMNSISEKDNNYIFYAKIKQ